MYLCKPFCNARESVREKVGSLMAKVRLSSENGPTMDRQRTDYGPGNISTGEGGLEIIETLGILESLEPPRSGKKGRMRK